MPLRGGIQVALGLALLLVSISSGSLASSPSPVTPAATTSAEPQVDQPISEPSARPLRETRLADPPIVVEPATIPVEDPDRSTGAMAPVPPAATSNEPQFRPLPPVRRPAAEAWTARRLQVPSLGIDVAVHAATSDAHERFPPHDGAYLHSSSAQPGSGTNAYIFAHAVASLFQPLWWAQVGQDVFVTMSDGQTLAYRITAIVRDVPCPDPSKPKPPNLPPALANATHCDTSWLQPTPSERLTLQTSQGYNRNYGELVVIAEPTW